MNWVKKRMTKNAIHRGVHHARGVKRQGRAREVGDRKVRSLRQTGTRGTSHDDHEEAETYTAERREPQSADLTVAGWT